MLVMRLEYMQIQCFPRVSSIQPVKSLNVLVSRDNKKAYLIAKCIVMRQDQMVASYKTFA